MESNVETSESICGKCPAPFRLVALIQIKLNKNIRAFNTRLIAASKHVFRSLSMHFTSQVPSRMR